TDLIVGFPGETEAQFEETLTLVETAGFDEAYTFRYSLREGTPAVKLPQRIPDSVAAARLERLIELVRGQTRRRNLGRIGSCHEVLIERPARRGGLMLGRTRGNQLVVLPLSPDSIGEYRQVRLTGTTGSTFTATLAVPELALYAGP